MDLQQCNDILVFAASGGHKNIITLLEVHGADVLVEDIDGWSALHCAADNGHSNTCMELLTLGCSSLNADTQGLIPLHCAAANGHTEAVKTLIAIAPQSVEIGDRIKGWTALHHAASMNSLHVIEELLNKKANVTTRDLDGLNALDIARASNASRCVTLLEEKMIKFC